VLCTLARATLCNSLTDIPVAGIGPPARGSYGLGRERDGHETTDVAGELGDRIFTAARGATPRARSWVVGTGGNNSY